MLQIILPAVEENELWDEINQEFIPVPAQKSLTLRLEHSLISLSKWESKWRKPFFTKKDKTVEETIDYIRCMTLENNIDPQVYNRLTDKHLKEIHDYMYAPMTATVVKERKTEKRGKGFITSELIYYWMIVNDIPFECEKWHLNRLITLIDVCSAYNTQPQKMSKSALARQYAEINAANRKKYNSKG